ncbi:MAG: hypothetical protein U0U67_06075 [Chitinophagales bacterium]
MKKVTTRMMIAMFAFVFAAATTSCQKEENVSPTPNTPQAPAIPVTPVTPSVSMKPRFIITSESGTTTRKESFVYDSQNKLVKYESSSATAGLDSVLFTGNSVIFKSGSGSSQFLFLNTDKTFKSLFLRTDETTFENNQNNLTLMKKIRPGNTPLVVGEFDYTSNNLTKIGAEIRIDINYFNDLPYQKGINEIPVALKPIKFYKVMEIENTTSTILYSKMIRQIIIDFGNRKELHDYAYTFDANNRITQIRDTQTFVTSSSSTQKVVISAITY